jgi:hypothetical protein
MPDSPTRVEAVQQALTAFTGVPAADQILMLGGTKLDPGRALAAYQLPHPYPAAVDGDARAADEPLLLYCRPLLRPGAPAPPPEALPPIWPAGTGCGGGMW